MSTRYRFGYLTLEPTFELSRAPAANASGATADSIVAVDRGEYDELRSRWAALPDPSPTPSPLRIDADGRLWGAQPRHFVFCLDAAARHLTVGQASDCRANWFEHYLLDWALPYVVATDDKLALHATGVVIGGKATAFIGASGAGKSTIATALAQRGLPLVADDCLIIDPTQSPIEVVPSYPTARLNDDSAAQLDLVTQPADAQDKHIVDAESASVRFADEPSPLGQLIVLSPSPQALAPSLEPMPGAAALTVLLEQSSVWPGHIAAAIDLLASVISEVPPRRLVYAHDFAGLEALLDLLAKP